MGGATVQRALFARLAAAATAQTAARSEASFGPVGGFADAAATRLSGPLSADVLATTREGARPPRGTTDSKNDTNDTNDTNTVAGAVLETLVDALPDPNAHAAVMRVLGATFVNETASFNATFNAEDASSNAKSKPFVCAPAGPYSRALMTVVVGLLASDSSARLKHISKTLVDAPAVPPAVITLLRALCRLPLGGAEDDPTSTPESAFVPGADPETTRGFSVAREDAESATLETTALSGNNETTKKKTTRRVVRWGGVALPDSSDAVGAALASLLELVARRPTAARSQPRDCAGGGHLGGRGRARARAIRAVVGKLHPVETLAQAVEAYAEFHLGVAAGAGAAALADARRVAAEASAAMGAPPRRRLRRSARASPKRSGSRRRRRGSRRDRRNVTRMVTRMVTPRRARWWLPRKRRRRKKRIL